jgi:WXG100 family type VII secretion target
MADRIRLTVSDINRTAAVFTKDSQEIISMLNALTNEKNNLVSNWEGDSSRAFSGEFDQFVPQVRQFAQLIEQIGQQLKNAGQTLQETDTQVASALHR